MFYGDLHLLDILLFAGIAAFLFYKLRGVLGKRTGFQKKTDIGSIEETRPTTKSDIDENKEPIIEQNYKELEKAYKHLENFNHQNFLEGAKNAFEKIVNLFNDGKKDELKSLLTKETYKIFSKAIDLNKNQPKTQILSITIESINKVWVEGKKIFITISYNSNQIGSSGKSEENKKDKWTFEKKLSSTDPVWLLYST